jgi:hypothetical protein
MLSRQRHCSRQLETFAIILKLHDNIDNKSGWFDNRLPTISTIRDNTPICKVHVRIGRDTAFTGCTVLPVTGVDEMTKREMEDRMFAVFGGVFCALLIGCWAALVIALI